MSKNVEDFLFCIFAYSFCWVRTNNFTFSPGLDPNICHRKKFVIEPRIILKQVSLSILQQEQKIRQETMHH